MRDQSYTPHVDNVPWVGKNTSLVVISIHVAVDGVAFLAYIEQVIAPKLRPGQIVVMDLEGVRESCGGEDGIEPPRETREPHQRSPILPVPFQQLRRSPLNRIDRIEQRVSKLPPELQEQPLHRIQLRTVSRQPDKHHVLRDPCVLPAVRR